MNVLFYLSESAKGAVRYLEKALKDPVPGGDLRICRRLEDLSQELKRPWGRHRMAVLVAATHQELETFLALQALLDDVRIILILPDRDRETVSKGHKLYPRFLSYIDSDFNDVTAVLGKMLEYIKFNEFTLYSN